MTSPIVSRLPSSAPEPAHLAESRALYERGLYLQAHRRATAHAPLREWTGSIAERIFAGRLLGNVGSSRAARLHYVRAHRLDPRNTEAAYYFGRGVLERRGPLACLSFIDAHPELAPAPAHHQADWLLLRARACAHLRDFQSMERSFAEAEALAPDFPWLWVERSAFLELQDRLPEALDAARAALSIQPLFRPALQQCADVLVALGREDEALAVLEQGDAALESPALTAQLGMLYRELGRFEHARAAWERVQALSPELDAKGFTWLASQRCWAEYLAGNLDRARELTALVDDKYHRRILARLEAATAIDRKVLDVPFVRQHHMTCAPATLAAIGQFWRMATDHLTVAADICYDGTPAASERRWAEEHGWAVREFTVDWDTTVALIDRGVPFTLTTTETASSHLQGVIGYDRTRQTLLVRDPSSRAICEFDAEATFERYAFSGPRGMVLVPLAEKTRLDELALPDAEQYDALYAIEQALRVHDRARAQAVLDGLVRDDPEHRLTVDATWALASYDQDPQTSLRCAERALAHHPKQPRLLRWKLSCLKNLARSEERLSLLRELVRAGAKEPLYWLSWAEELLSNEHAHDEAQFLLQRVVRYRPHTAQAYRALGDLRWAGGDRAAAVALYRLASCVDDKDEDLASTFFSSARLSGDATAALAFLQDRFERFGGQSPGPALTLAWAHRQLDRDDEARRVFDAAIALRPADGELQLAAAEASLNAGDEARALELLAAAEGRVRREAHLRTAASIAWHRAELAEALAHHREILVSEPLAIGSHQSIAELLAGTEGDAAALAHLRSAIERFPHHQPLHELYLSWERQHDVPRAISVLDRLIASHPTNAWNLRERALLLARLQRHDEALRDLRAAAELEPRSPYQHSVAGYVHETAGRTDQAREAYRESTRRSVDLLVAWPPLLDLAHGDDAYRAELDFVAAELTRQTLVSGEGLLSFLARAQGVWAADALTAFVRDRQRARPELWATWAALVRQLVASGAHDEALEVATRATERFPLLPGLWVDRARAHHALDDEAARIAALTEAVRLNPAFGYAARTLADAHADAGDGDAEKAVLEHAVRASPLDAALRLRLASCLWRRDEKQEAIAAQQAAARLETGNDETWNLLARWSAEANLRETAISFARGLTQTHGGRAGPWYGLARLLDRPEQREERLAALEEALARAPRWPEAHDLKVVTLCEAGRHDEADRAAHPEAFGDEPPIGMQARAAWVIAQRGDVAGAIRAMEDVLARAASNTWALTRTIDWASELKDYERAVRWARKLVEVDPEAPHSHGYLAEALQLWGDRAGAKEAYARAHEIAADYLFAGWKLFELHLEDGETTHARRVLERLEEHVSRVDVLIGRIRLELRERDFPAARKSYEALCALPDVPRGAIDAARNAYHAAGREDEAAAVLDAAVAGTEAPVAVGAAWATVRSQRGLFFVVWRKLFALASEAAREGALTAYLESIAEAGRARTLRWFVRFFRNRLGASTRVWGTVGYALIQIGDAMGAYRWLRTDWRERRGLEPWMLNNLALAAELCSDGPLRHAVSAHALSLAPDHTTDLHRLWVAFDCALAGNADAAEVHLAALSRPAQLEGTGRYLAELSRVLITLVRAGDPGRAVKEARAAFRTLWNEGMYESALLRRIGWRAGLAIHQRARGPLRWAWWLGVRVQLALASSLP